MAEPPPAAEALQLPVQVVSPADISRLLREAETLEEFMHRQTGQALEPPRTSRLLQEFAAANSLNVLQAADRQAATTFLQAIKAHAPVVHMSFATDPSAAFTAKLVTWLRTNIHPQLLVRIGLQPSIAAGCVVRTPNKVFDFSLRQKFTDQRGRLIDTLKAGTS